MKSAQLFTDGGARGNPGPAGIGVVIILEDSKVVRLSRYIGETTNNQAEYQALLEGLKEAKAHEIDSLHVYMDSELVVKQLHGQYKVKHPDLQPMHRRARELMNNFAKIEVSHVRRQDNKEADRLVNQALDNRK